MAEFDRARVLIHMCADPYNLTSGSYALAAKTMNSGNQEAVKIMITIARVKIYHNCQLTESIIFNLKLSIMHLWLRGYTTARRRSMLIAAKCTTDTVDEILEMKTKTSSKLVAQSFRNIRFPRRVTNTGSHTMVTIKSAIAKLNRRNFGDRRRRGYCNNCYTNQACQKSGLALHQTVQ
ncbi:hypothetical protein ACROYT_G023399 [Oculina patagonica]